jgi:O-antigen biosynthesis protein
MKTLRGLYETHQGKVSDKWSLYLSQYDRLLSPYRDLPIRLLEIGVQNGGSLEIWGQYFPNAQKVVGCDINPDCAALAYDDSRIQIVIGDANTNASESCIAEHAEQFDLIIDDGSHRSGDIVQSFARYFPRLAEDGLFIAEDLHCSYWQEFEGGLFFPYSSIAFFKSLADIVNQPHWGVNRSRSSLLDGLSARYGMEFDEHWLAEIQSIEFVNSMCIVRKQESAANELGPRVVAGQEELVVPGHHELAGERMATADESGNEWANRKRAPAEEFTDIEQTLAEHAAEALALREALKAREAELQALHRRLRESDTKISELRKVSTEKAAQIAELNQGLAERDASIQALNQTLAERQHDVTALLHSTSWRITGPLRVLAHQFKRARRIGELAGPATRQGGGVGTTLRKALWIYRRDGVEGLRHGFRVVASRQVPTASILDTPYHQAVSQRAETTLAPRVLIIAETSIPQCTKYRVQQKQELLALLGYESTIIDWPATDGCLHALQTHSLVIFYRVPAYHSVIPIMEEAQRLRVPTFWEVDDFIFDADVLAQSRALRDLDKTIFNQLLEGANLYRRAMLMCDGGIASTKSLAHAMRTAGVKDVHVIENAFDVQTLELAHATQRRAVSNDQGIVRIVYGSGTNTHNVDFLEAASALALTLRKFPNARLRIIGMLDLPEEFALLEAQVERFPICPYSEYLKLMADCDISIAPLEDYIFNESKSNIKYLEASALKLPSLCSPRAAFSERIIHGVNGLLCKTPADWIHALEILIGSPGRRISMGEAAYASVMDHYAPKSIAKRQVLPLLAPFKKKSAIRVLSVNCLYYPRSFGGATIVAEELNRRLQQTEDVEVHVFTSIPSSVAAPYTIRRYDAQGINVYGVGLPDSIGAREQFENPNIIDTFQDVLRVVRPDLVHFHSIQGIGVSAIQCCLQTDIPYVITLHDAWWLCDRQFMIDRRGRYCGQTRIDQDVCASCVEDFALNRHRTRLMSPALHGAAMLLAPSRFFADLYVANGFSNVRVNKNGIRRPRVAKRLRRQGPLRFAYVGGNTEIKGIHLVKALFSEESHPGAQLVLVDNALNLGRPSYHSEDLAGMKNVEVVPAYTQDSIDDFFSDIDVLLFPTQCKESFGLTVREALARAVWVIATDAGGAVEDIIHGSNGLIIPFDDCGKELKRAFLQTISHFESISAGSEIAFEADTITFFEAQVLDLVQAYTDALSLELTATGTSN